MKEFNEEKQDRMRAAILEFPEAAELAMSLGLELKKFPNAHLSGQYRLISLRPRWTKEIYVSKCRLWHCKEHGSPPYLNLDGEFSLMAVVLAGAKANDAISAKGNAE